MFSRKLNSRLKNLENKAKEENAQIHVIFCEKDESEENAKIRFQKENKTSENDHYVLICLDDEETISRRKK